jgi:hypothetical protein
MPMCPECLWLEGEVERLRESSEEGACLLRDNCAADAERYTLIHKAVSENRLDYDLACTELEQHRRVHSAAR